MGLKFSNLTTYPHLSVQTRKIDFYGPNDVFILFKGSASNFDSSFIPKRVATRVLIGGNSYNYTIKLYKIINTTNIDSINPQFIMSYLTDSYCSIEGSKGVGQFYKDIYIDEIFNEYYSSSFDFYFAIRCTAATTISFDIDSLNDTEVIFGEIYNTDKESFNHESLSNDFGFLGNSRIDLYKNKLYFNLLNITTSNKTPLSISVTYSYGNNGIFGKNIICEYEYKAKFTLDYIEVINPIGDSSFYLLTDRDYAKNKYDIDSVEDSGPLFVNLTNFSYIVKTGNTSFILFNRDSSKINYTFDGTLNQNTNIYINSIVTLKGTIGFSWTNNKLSSISINNTSISLTYSNDFVCRIDYDKSRYCLFEYYTYNSNKYLKKIKYCDNRNSDQTEIVHNTACLEYQTSSPYKLTYVYDDLTKIGVKYDYNNSNELLSISTILKNTSDYSNKITINKNSNITKITDHLGKEYYYYFDNYGKCYQIIDDLGNISSKEYQRNNLISSDALKTGESTGMINSYNLLENPCFVEIPNDQIYSWSCNRQEYVDLEKSIGISGMPSLRASNVRTLDVSLEQSLYDLSLLEDNKYIFSGNIKGSGSITLSVIANGSTIATKSFTANNAWQKIELTNILMPHTLTSCKVKINIGYNADVKLCNFTLSENKLIHNNLIINGNLDDNYYADAFRYWDKVDFDTDDVVSGANLSFPLNMLLKRKLTITGNESVTKHLYQEIDLSGNAGEELFLSFFFKTNNTNNDICYSYIKVRYLIDGEKTYEKNFGDNNGIYVLNNQTVITEGAYDKVTIGIKIRNKNSSYFASFGLFKEEYGTYYSFTEKNSLEEIANGKLSNEVEFNEDSLVKRFRSNSGEIFEYSYRENGDVEKITDLNSNEFTFNYDNNDYLSKNTIKTINNKRLILEQTNDSNGNPTYIKGYDESETSLVYDSRERLTQKTLPSSLVESFTYNQKDFLTKKQYNLGTNNIIEHNFTYDSNENISDVNITNGSDYEFSLYDEWGSLKTLILDNSTLNTFTYYKHDNIYTGLLSSKAYSNGTYYFYYDNKHRLSQVVFGGVDLVVEYFYDENDLLIKKVDLSGTTFYEYDLNGRLVKKLLDTTNQMSYSNEYDNLDNVQSKTIDINGISLNYNYAYLYENNEYTQGSYFSRLESVSNNDYVFENFKLKYGGDPIYYDVTPARDNSINRNIIKFVYEGNRLIYDVDDINSKRKSKANNQFNYEEWSNAFGSHKQVFLWVRVNSLNSNSHAKLLSFGNDTNEYAYLQCEGNGTIKLYYDGINDNFYRINPGEWNLIGVDFEEIDDGEDITTRINLFINKYKQYVSLNRAVVSDITRIIVGEFSQTNNINNIATSSSEMAMPFDVLYLSIGNNSHSLDGYKGIYNDGYKYVFNIPQKKTKGVCYYNHSVYGDLDVIPLNGSFTSIKGLKPTSFTYGDSTYALDKTKLFKYDGKISNIDAEYTNRHIYGSYNDDTGLTGKTKSLLSYDLGLGNTGTISFRFKMDSINGFNNFLPRTLLAVPSISGGHKLLVAISDVSQTISLYYPGISETRIYTDLTVTADEWHLFTITWNTSYIKIYLDNQASFSRWHNSAINLSNLITYIGCNYIDNKPIQHLNGVIEMVTYSNSYMTSIHSALLDGGTPISHITSFDELKRPCLKEILTSKTRLTHRYDYYDELVTENNDEYYKASGHPCVETLEDGTKIVYSYDSSGNITSKVSSKNDVLEENISYEYDASGRLVDETCYQGSNFDYHYRYIYNTNSDIIEIVGYNSNGVYLNKKELVYNSVIKGQINKIRYYSYEGHWEFDNELTISFNNDSFRPSSYKGNSVSWQGRRLTGYGSNSYSYNSEGIRISKTTSSGTYSYVLDNNKVIKETKPTYGDVYYHYDEEGMLVGFHYNSNEYFYSRDLTGNITKILDENGNIKVEYKYNAWGKVLSITGDNTIKNVNSYLYKGYYYDFETQLYYCNSRYYDPDVCRWIGSDNAVFFSIGAISKINLNCYCFNNPIVYFDFGGLFPKRVNISPWDYYIHDAKVGNKKHIHIIWKGKKYSQNIDGTIHHGKELGNPPKWVQDKLREAGIWDWKQMFSNVHIDVPYFNPIPIIQKEFDLEVFPSIPNEADVLIHPLNENQGTFEQIPIMPNHVHLETIPKQDIGSIVLIISLSAVAVGVMRMCYLDDNMLRTN